MESSSAALECAMVQHLLDSKYQRSDEEENRHWGILWLPWRLLGCGVCVCEVCVGGGVGVCGRFGDQQALLNFNVDETDLFWEKFPETTSNLNLVLKL